MSSTQSTSHARPWRLERPRIARRIAVRLLAIALLCGVATATGRLLATRDRILPGVTIDGVDVSGLARPQAIERIDAHVAPLLAERVTIAAAGQRWTVTTAALGRRPEVAAAVDQALAGPRMPWPLRLYHRLTREPVRQAVPLAWTIDKTELAKLVRPIAARVARAPGNASITLQPGRMVIRHAHNGRMLDVNGAIRQLINAPMGDGTVPLPVRRLHPTVGDDHYGMTITIDRARNLLTLYNHLASVKVYPVATAEAGFTTPAGVWEITWKEVNPTWHNPAPDGWAKNWPLVIPPGPDNPLGTRALHLNAPGIVIHGTPEDSSIGSHASHGCIRMHMHDAEDLFGRVPVGIPVLIF